MPDISIHPQIVAIAGASRAIYIAHLVKMLQRDAERGAESLVYADKLISEDTGLSYEEVRRAREWWRDIGVLSYDIQGIPPKVAYRVRSTLEAWVSWCNIQFGATAKTIWQQRHNVVAAAPQRCGSSATTDLDDDLEREIAQTAHKSGWEAEAWAAEARAIKQRCALRPGIRDLQAYTRASLIAAAQAGPPPAPTPQPAAHTQRQQPRRGRSEKILRPQVTYTEAEREAARERARQRIAERRARSFTSAGE